MTADEVTFAGGKSLTNSPNAWYYLNANATGTTAEKSITGINLWWTMSPCYFNSSSIANAWYVAGSGYPGNLNYNGYHVSSSIAVRPALSLKSNTLWLSGNGTIHATGQ